MKGTEKIIAHIQADAKAQADAILAQAEQQCAEIRRDYEIKAKDATPRRSASASSRIRTSLTA